MAEVKEFKRKESDNLKYRSHDHGHQNTSTVLSQYLFKENLTKAKNSEVEEYDLKNLSNLKAQLSTSSNNNAVQLEDEI